MRIILSLLLGIFLLCFCIKGHDNPNKTDILSNIKFKHRGKGDNGGLKVLVVTIDNRDLNSNINSNDYVSYSSVLLFRYCKIHGYDFLKFTPNSTSLAQKVFMKYRFNESTSNDKKYGMSGFHSGFKAGRASSWLKVPILWFLIKPLGKYYDYFWFLDSDVAISPYHMGKSLYDSFQVWKNETKILRGNKDILKSKLVFLSNFPWRDDLPCAGVIVLKPTNDTEGIMREWWDFEIPFKNYEDFMEQDALWYQLESSVSYGFQLNFSVATLVDEKQFLSSWHGISALWTVHIANYERNRVPYFKNMLRMAGLNDKEKFKEIVSIIYQHHHLDVDVFEIVEAIEEYSQYKRNVSNLARRTEYPRFYRGKADERWHSVLSSSKYPAKPSIGHLYDNLPIRIDGDPTIWLVYNDFRHQFESVDMLSLRGFDLDMVLSFRKRDDVSHIPIDLISLVTIDYPVENDKKGGAEFNLKT